MDRLNEKQQLKAPLRQYPTKMADLVKVGTQVEKQKFGRLDERQLNLFRDEKGIERVEISKRILGFDFDAGMNRALFALQKILTGNNYEGTIKAPMIRKSIFGTDLQTPAVYMTLGEYFEAYGLKKYQKAGGKTVYPGMEAQNALENLYRLAKKDFRIFRVLPEEDGSKRILEEITSIIKIIKDHRGLSDTEAEEIIAGKNDKSSGFIWQAHPILGFQARTYHILKPPDHYDRIKTAAGKATKYPCRFIDWLYVKERDLYGRLLKKHQHPYNTGSDDEWSFDIPEKNLIGYMRLDHYLETRNKKKIRQILNRCYSAAIKYGLLRGYLQVKGKTRILERFSLDPTFFKELREKGEGNVEIVVPEDEELTEA